MLSWPLWLCELAEIGSVQRTTLYLLLNLPDCITQFLSIILKFVGFAQRKFYCCYKFFSTVLDPGRGQGVSVQADREHPVNVRLLLSVLHRADRSGQIQIHCSSNINSYFNLSGKGFRRNRLKTSITQFHPMYPRRSFFRPFPSSCLHFYLLPSSLSQN